MQAQDIIPSLRVLAATRTATQFWADSPPLKNWRFGAAGLIVLNPNSSLSPSPAVCTHHFDLTQALPNRRCALLAAVGLLALPALQVAAAPAAAPSDVWPRASQVPGGIARLSLGPAPTRPVAHAGDVPLLVLGDVMEWTALVGIALAATLGKAGISVEREGGGQRLVAYTVASKRYSEQRLRVAPGTVDLSPEDQTRYERERAHQEQVMATFTEPWPQASLLPMRVPVTGRRSSSFGLRRVFNGQSRNPHSGMDFAAATGTPVRAPLPGRVIDTGDYFSMAIRSGWTTAEGC